MRPSRALKIPNGVRILILLRTRIKQPSRWKTKELYAPVKPNGGFSRNHASKISRVTASTASPMATTRHIKMDNRNRKMVRWQKKMAIGDTRETRTSTGWAAPAWTLNTRIGCLACPLDPSMEASPIYASTPKGRETACRKNSRYGATSMELERPQ